MKTVSIHKHPQASALVQVLCESDSLLTEEEARVISAWEGYPPDANAPYGFRLLGKRLGPDDRPRYMYRWECVGPVRNTGVHHAMTPPWEDS